MKLYRGTRWWIVCPCLVLIVVGCVLASIKRSYSPDESRQIFQYLSLKHASEQEVVGVLEHHSKIVTDPVTSQSERRYYFSTHSLTEGMVHESWAVYDEKRKLKHFIISSVKLTGMKLWKYRLDSVLSLFAK